MWSSVAVRIVDVANEAKNRKAWGILIIICSLPCVIAGGWFIMGFIFGTIGGVKVLRWNHEIPAKIPLECNRKQFQSGESPETMVSTPRNGEPAGMGTK
jgi:hypothetical protein